MRKNWNFGPNINRDATKENIPDPQVTHWNSSLSFVFHFIPENIPKSKFLQTQLLEFFVRYRRRPLWPFMACSYIYSNKTDRISKEHP